MRHPYNPNLTLIYGSEWQGMSLLWRQEPFIEQYLQINHFVIRHVFREGRSCLVVILILRFPYAYPCPEHGVMTAFFRSLKEQIRADINARTGKSGRQICCDLDYIWTREQSSNSNDHSHYHVALFIDLEAYYRIGSLNQSPVVLDEERVSPIIPRAKSLAERINRAWARAIGIQDWQAVGLVQFPDNAEYRLKPHDPEFFEGYLALFKRLSYFAKARSKDYTQRGGPDWYGSSHVPRSGVFLQRCAIGWE